MKFANILVHDIPAIALANGNGLRGLAQGDAGFPGMLEELLFAGADLSAVGASLAGAPQIDPTSVRFLPPLTRPSKVLCVGLNYADHTAEVGLEQPPVPEVFPRFPSSLIGHEAPIARPPESDKLDFEAELVVVIGRRGRRISKAAALDHVAGYSIFNDATLRDYQFRTSQWAIGKNFDQTGAFGPWLVTPDALPAGGKGLRIQGRLNGEIVQDAVTDQFIYDIPALIELLSETMTLEPGDVILTGTPAGVGWSRTSRLMMKAGDVFEAEVEGIGILRNRVIDEPV